jgi:hypothetical protein
MEPCGSIWLANRSDSLCGDGTWRFHLAGESSGFALRRWNLAVPPGWRIVRIRSLRISSSRWQFGPRGVGREGCERHGVGASIPPSRLPEQTPIAESGVERHRGGTGWLEGSRIRGLWPLGVCRAGSWGFAPLDGCVGSWLRFGLGLVGPKPPMA